MRISFLGCAGLQPCGAGESLGPDHHLNGQICRLADLCIGVAGDGYGPASFLPGQLQATQDVGSTSAGGDSHHQVFAGEMAGTKVLRTQLPAVFRALHCFDESLFPSGNQAYNEVR